VNSVSLWIKAVRPYAYSASVVPIAIGGFHARLVAPPAFSWLRFGVALAGGILIHTAANLWNDYYDFRDGVDRKGAGEGSGVLVHGEMTPAACFRGAVISAMLAALAGLFLIWQVGWSLLALLVAGLFGAWAYSAGPLSPKHRALGEIWVFLLMGAGMTLGGHMAQTGRFSWGAIVTGIPAGLLMTLLLFVNNLRDLESDRQAGLHTLPMRFSLATNKGLTAILLLLPFLMATAMAFSRWLPLAILLALLTLPTALRWLARIWKTPIDNSDVMKVAMLHMGFGLLFAAGLWIGR